MIAVVIPCFNVKKHILKVLLDIGSEVNRIYVVDDACPENSGQYVESACNDSRVKVIFHKFNQGVGGAVMTGYKAAVADGADVIVKIDGDGQMDCSYIENFVQPILNGAADYTKGNRFYNLQEIYQMPLLRLLGNSVLSFMTKISSGYWDIFDPTNGFTAIHAEVVKTLPLNKVSKRYFFETDMLFHLNIIRAVVQDIPIHAKYSDEVSNLKISGILGEFLIKHVRNFLSRIFYNYFLRDMSLASVQLIVGVIMIIFGVLYGAFHWLQSFQAETQTPAGTVMVSALPIIVGIQFLMAFIGYDMSSIPRQCFYLKKIYIPKSKELNSFSKT